MIIESKQLKENLRNYSNKNTKISRMLERKEIYKLKNGLYETNPNVEGHLLANAIYGPSYLSFDFALAYYGVIPEAVHNYTCATFGKRKKKIFENYFGSYIYRDVPKKVYSIGVRLIVKDGYSFQIATLEKAICDKLYTISPIKNLNELKHLLFEDLRIDEDELKKIDLEELKIISEAYGSTNVSLFYKYMKGNQNE